MPVTVLDARTALIVIDLQKGIVAYAGAEAMEGVLAKASLLADAFRRHGLLVVLVNVAGGASGRTEQPRRLRDLPGDWAELVPELKQQPTDLTVTKQSWGAFHNTGLEAVLKNLGITQVVIAGVSTSIGVESTARQAFEAGLNVTLAIDAMTDTQPEAHHNSLTRIFPRLGETGTTAEILVLLESRQS